MLDSAIDQGAHAVKEGREAVQGLRALAAEPNGLAEAIIKIRKVVAMTTATFANPRAHEDRCSCSEPFDADRATQTRRGGGAIG